MDRCQAERIGELGLRRRQSDRVILDHADRQLAPEQLTQKPAKKLLNDTEEATLSLAIELEGQAYNRLHSSDDFREGVEAFQAKRTPNFRGS